MKSEKSFEKNEYTKKISKQMLPYYRTSKTLLTKEFGEEAWNAVQSKAIKIFEKIDYEGPEQFKGAALFLTICLFNLTKTSFINLIIPLAKELKQEDYEYFGYFDEKVANHITIFMLSPFTETQSLGDGMTIVDIDIERLYSFYLKYSKEFKDQDQLQNQESTTDPSDKLEVNQRNYTTSGTDSNESSDGRCVHDALIMALSIEFEEDVDQVMKQVEKMKNSDEHDCQTCNMFETCLRMRLAYDSEEEPNQLRHFSHIATSLGLYETPNLLENVASTNADLLETLKLIGLEIDYKSLIEASQVTPFSHEHAIGRLTTWHTLLVDLMSMSESEALDTIISLELMDIAKKEAKVEAKENEPLNVITPETRRSALLQFVLKI